MRDAHNAFLIYQFYKYLIELNKKHTKLKMYFFKGKKGRPKLRKVLFDKFEITIKIFLILVII